MSSNIKNQAKIDKGVKIKHTNDLLKIWRFFEKKNKSNNKTKTRDCLCGCSLEAVLKQKYEAKSTYFLISIRQLFIFIVILTTTIYLKYLLNEILPTRSYMNQSIC